MYLTAGIDSEVKHLNRKEWKNGKEMGIERNRRTCLSKPSKRATNTPCIM
jgi:hypothetical protein